MKTLLLYALCVCLLFSCNKSKKSDTLIFESTTIENTACSNCPNVSITFPKAVEKTKISETINSTLQRNIITTLLFDESLKIDSIPDAISSFTSAFNELQKQYIDESAIWEAKINAEITYENPSILSIELNTYLFTGGAHGYTSVQLLNFDKKQGNALKNSELFKDSLIFQNYAETQFRKQEKIALEQPINHTGFMFDNNTFYLPENIGYTKNGIQLLYNQYEVASYADGPIKLVLPYATVKEYLALNHTKASSEDLDSKE